jgi:hypothetical protein
MLKVHHLTMLLLITHLFKQNVKIIFYKFCKCIARLKRIYKINPHNIMNQNMCNVVEHERFFHFNTLNCSVLIF